MDGIRSKVAAGYEPGTGTGTKGTKRSGIRWVAGTTQETEDLHHVNLDYIPVRFGNWYHQLQGSKGMTARLFPVNLQLSTHKLAKFACPLAAVIYSPDLSTHMPHNLPCRYFKVGGSRWPHQLRTRGGRAEGNFQRIQLTWHAWLGCFSKICSTASTTSSPDSYFPYNYYHKAYLTI